MRTCAIMFMVFMVFLLIAPKADADALSDAFASGKAMGQAGNVAVLQGITAAKGTDVVPNYTSSAPESRFFGSQATLLEPGRAKIAGCATGPVSTNAYHQQECDAVNFLANNPSKRVQYPISKADPLFANAKTITANPEAYIGNMSGTYSGCTTKTVTNPALTSIERCNDYLNLTSTQCTVTRAVTVSTNYTYSCSENGSSCQSLQNPSCTYPDYKLYDMTGAVVGKWDPLGNVTWQGQTGRWAKNSPTPPKYWGTITWSGYPWYFDANYNIFYDTGTQATAVAFYRPGYPLTNLIGQWVGAWFQDGSIVYTGVSGTWNINQPTPPTYLGCANFNGTCWDTTSSGYVPAAGITVSVSGGQWSWTDPNQSCTPVAKTCSASYTDSWPGGYWGGGNYSCLGYVPAGTYGAASWQCPYTYDCSYQSCTNQTYSGSFQYYQPTPPKFPGDIHLSSGALLHFDASNNILDNSGAVIAHWGTGYQLLESTDGVAHGYFSVNPSNDGGAIVWDNVAGTWTLSQPTPPKWWGSFTVGSKTVNFEQPSVAGVLFDTIGSQIGRFDQLPQCSAPPNPDGTCPTYARIYNCSTAQSDPAATLTGSNNSVSSDTEVPDPNCTSATSPLCGKTSRQCLEGPETRTINGLPVYRDCWKWADNYACTDKGMSSDCQALIDKGCTETGRSCIATLADGSCDVLDRVFNCVTKPATTGQIADCGTQTYCMSGNCFDAGHPPDPDFAKTVAGMEAAREAGTYMDPGTLQLFKGFDNRCTKGYLGLKNCCKTSGGGGGMSNSALFSALGQAASNGTDYVVAKASPYVYDAMYASDVPYLMDKATYAWQSNLTNGAQTYNGFTFNPSISLYGITWTTASTVPAATLGIGTNIGIGGGGSVMGGTLYYNPYIMGAQIALMVVQDLISCTQDEQMLAMKRGQNLCHATGSYCSKTLNLVFSKICVETTQSYCCFNSRLARIINEQGRGQIGKGWGSGDSPDCSGFTAAELQGLDFSKMDMTEFIAEIMPKMPDAGAIATKNQQLIQQQIQNYYKQ